MAKIVKHAFLSPGHNCWVFWTNTGSTNITNPGESHRALEVLAYAVDLKAAEGWELVNVYSDNGTPNFVVMQRTEEVPE
ncbi:MAG: hypothetical protein WCJ56_14080 [bacterium]